MNSQGFGGAVEIECVCSKCNKTVKYVTSPSVNDTNDIRRTDIGLRTVIASFLNGSTYTKTINFLNLIGVDHYSPNTFIRLNDQLNISIQNETNSILDKNIEESKRLTGNELFISVDFTWNARNKGKLGTLTVLCMNTGKPLFRVHIIRVGRLKNFDAFFFFFFFFLYFF